MSSARLPSLQRRLTVTTEEADRAETARLERLPLGSYVIQETGTASDDEGEWTLTSVDCGDGPVPFEQGRVVVRLTEERPRRACRFVNTLGEAEPPAPPDVVPSEPGEPDLVVRKRALTRAVAVNGIATFEVTVTNAGHRRAAEGAIVADGVTDAGQIVSAAADRGECEAQLRLAVLRGRDAPARRHRDAPCPGPCHRLPRAWPTCAAAGSASAESALANNADAAAVRVRDISGVLGVCARSGPVARAAC